jgi:hypothetical protein
LLTVLPPWRPILRQKKLPLRQSLFKRVGRASTRSRESIE